MTIYDTNQLKQIFKSQIPFVRKLSYAAAVINRRRYIEPRRRKPANSHRNRGYAIEEFDRLDPDTFKKMFRLDRPTFELILEKIHNRINREETYSISSSGQPISTTTRLVVTLRWLAGGSHLDLCFAWGISKTSFFMDRGVLWPTIEAINATFSIGVPIGDEVQLEQMAIGFREHSNGVLDNCIIAIDGLAVRTRYPYKWEVNNPKEFRNRKGGFGFVILAGCDINCKFHFATANHAGSTNDITAWHDSDLFKSMDAGRLPARYFVIGDEAFTNTNQFLSPWHGRGLGQYKDSFNYWLSHSRQCIERAFGILAQRWGSFWRIFRFSQHRWAMVSQVCMKLHNICVDRKVNPPLTRFNEDIQRDDRWIVAANEQEDDDQLRGRALGDRRREITVNLERDGITRPPHARCNNRA